MSLFMCGVCACVCRQVFCALCSSLKFKLTHLDGKEGRVCISCHSALIKSERHFFFRYCCSCIFEIMQKSFLYLVFRDVSKRKKKGVVCRRNPHQ